MEEFGFSLRHRLFTGLLPTKLTSGSAATSYVAPPSSSKPTNLNCFEFQVLSGVLVVVVNFRV